MKNLITALFISVVSSGATIAVYELYLKKNDKIIREVVYEQKSPNAKYTNGNKLNESPFKGADLNDNSIFVEASANARLAAVYIEASTGKKGSYSSSLGLDKTTGSGVVVTENGYIITNNHVVGTAKEVSVSLHDRRQYKAEVIGTDASTDLALVRILPKELKDRKLQPLEWKNSDEVEIGEWVLAVGNPFNLSSTVTAGIVSAKGRNIDILEGIYSVESFIQTDAAVNPGNSGGALVDAFSGALVGINTAIITRSGRYEGYSFAVPANLVKKVMQDLMEFGEVKRGFLGVTIKNVDNKIAESNSLNDLNGVYLESVRKGGAADEAGLKQGDIIVKVAGKEVNTSPELQEQVALFRPNQPIKIEYIRDSKRYEVEATLRNQDNDKVVADNPNTNKFQKKAEILSDLGVEVEVLSSETAKRLDINGGILLTKVKKGGAMDVINAEKGFIITSINDQKIRSIEDLETAILKAEKEILFSGLYEDYKGEYNYVLKK